MNHNHHPGVPTQIYGSIIPKLNTLVRIAENSAHLSARAKQRLKWVDYYLKSKNASLTCRYFGISQSCFYKWLKRFNDSSIKGLENHSTAPHTIRKREIAWDIQNEIEKLRRENPAWSKYKLAHILGRDHHVRISPSSVNRIFHDRHLFFPSPITKGQTASKKTWKIRRVRAPQGLRGASPGSLVEIDIKILNHLGRTFYQFTAIDTCTKIKFIRVYSSKRAHCGKVFVQAMLDFYEFKVRHINSDNGGEFLAECHWFLEEVGITHFFSRPRTPKDNPMVENTIKADKYEFWNWGNIASTVRELNKSAKYWMDKFNTYRPHQALDYMTPMEYYYTNFKI